MKPFFFLFFAGFLSCSAIFGKVGENRMAEPVGFRENKGQLEDQYHQSRKDILYYGSSNRMSYYLKQDGISYQLYKRDLKSEAVTVQRVDIKWLGTNMNAVIDANNVIGNLENFYNTPVGTEVLNIRKFETVLYKNIYSGIDVKYYHENSSLKYDYIVKPYADYKRIAFKVDGADKVFLNKDGTLTIKTPSGNVTEGKPIAFQDEDTLSANWVLQNNIVSIEVDEYDKSKELVIDPLVFGWDYTLSFSTSASLTAAIYDQVNDYWGNTYLAGYDYTGGVEHGLIKKLNNNGTEVWSASISATAIAATGCSMDKTNMYLYVTGVCDGFLNATIITSGAHQTVFGGGTKDAFLIKYDTAGNKLWATYYGGSGLETNMKCASDGFNNVYLTGATSSPNNISSGTVYQNSIMGLMDGFVVKFDSTGHRIWGSYYGGYNDDYIYDCKTGGDKLYICGATSSLSNIATSTSFQPAVSGLYGNGFLSCLDSSCALVWGTYYGGDSTDARGCRLDSGGNVYICGSTKSNQNISTGSTYQPVYSGALDGYLAKFDNAGTRLWGTYIGGAHRDAAMDVAIGKNGNLYVAGNTYSFSGIMATPYAYNPFKDSTAANFGQNGYLIELDANGQQKLWGTYLNACRYVFSCSSDTNDNVYVSGDKGQPSLSIAGYLAKFSVCNVSPVTIASNATSFCAGATVQLTSPVNPGVSKQWYRNDTAIAGAVNTFYNATLAGNYVLVWNGCPTSTSNMISLVELPSPSTVVTKNDVPCYNAPVGSITVTASGGVPPYSYIWANSTNTASSLSNLTAGTYTVTTSGANNCTKTDVVTINQMSNTPPSNPLAEICVVTVDTVTGKNLVVWEKQGNVRAEKYNLYRMSSMGNPYTLVATIPADQLSVYQDNTSLPSQEYYLYKIAEVDSCGYENPMSAYHKTIYLSASVANNGAVNLNWNFYEGKSYSSHYIMKSVNGGPFTMLNQVASSVNSYTDNSAPAGNVSYRIDIDLPQSCNPQKATALSRISSNYVTLDPLISAELNQERIRIIPNPATDVVSIVGAIPARITLNDIVGKLWCKNENADKLDLSQLPPGVYIMKLYDKDGRFYYQQKIIKK